MSQTRGGKNWVWAQGLAHFEPGFGFDPKWDGAFAGLLAVDVAADHGVALLVGDLAVENFGEGLLVDVADGFSQEITEEDVAVGIDKHGTEADVAVAFVTVEVEETQFALVGGIGEVVVKALELAIVGNDGVTLFLEVSELVQDAAEIGEVADPKYVAGHADVGLKIDLNFGVFAEVADEVREGAVVLLHDSGLDDDADTGAGAVFFIQQVLNAFESFFGAVVEGAEGFVDFGVNGFDGDIDVKGVVGEDFLDVGFGQSQGVGGKAEVNVEFLGEGEGVVEGLEDHGLAASEGNVEAFAGKLFGLTDDVKHVVGGEGGLDLLVNGAEGASEVASAAENDVVGHGGGEDLTGAERNAAGEFFFEVRHPADDLGGDALNFGHSDFCLRWHPAQDDCSIMASFIGDGLFFVKPGGSSEVKKWGTEGTKTGAAQVRL